MKNTVVKSARGVYYDLSVSPYEFITPYGDIFKFSSQKKLEIYTRDVVKEIKRYEDLMKRNDVKKDIPIELHELYKRKIYRAFYRSVER